MGLLSKIVDELGVDELGVDEMGLNRRETHMWLFLSTSYMNFLNRLWSELQWSPRFFTLDKFKSLAIDSALKILGKKWSRTSRLVASSKVLRNAIPTQNCDIIMTLPATTDDVTLMWLLARLRSRTPQLQVHVRHWKNTGVYAFYMTADFDNLLKGAEEFSIFKSVKSEHGGGSREFLYEEQSYFEGIEEEELFFTSQERQCIVYNMLLNLRALEGETLGKVKFLEGQSIVPLLQSNKIVSQVYPLHDNTTLKQLRNSWVTSVLEKQPLEKICSYFGVKIAMYFAYLGHYTSALIVPTVLGIVFWFIQSDSQLMEDLCFVTFALFNVFWATVYIELWLRRSSELAYKWGTLDKKGELLQEPRPLYTGYCTTSLVTGRVEPVYPSWKRHLFRYCVSLPVVAFCLFLVFYIMLWIFELQEWINDLVKEEHIPSLCYYLPKILLAVSIWIMDEIYKKIATWLNDKENYRMEETYENHLIIKLVLFQFVNSFLSLFYIAFYLQDMDRLRDQLATLLITRQVIGNIREAVVPYLIWKARLMKVGYDITGQMSPHSLEKEIKDFAKDTPLIFKEDKERPSPESPHDVADDKATCESRDSSSWESHTRTPDIEEEYLQYFRRHSIHTNISPLTLTQAEVESTMPKYEDTFDDHLEMFIQYGYVILFSSAFPLAALCAFLNNLIEIRSDAFKLCFHQQRPFGKRVENIGTWLDVLRVMGIIAVIVNSALIGVSGQASRMNPDLDTTSTFILIVSLEHVILALKTCIAYAIPNRPEWIDTEMARWEFRRREALKSVDGSPLDLRSPFFQSRSPSPASESVSTKTPEIPVRKNVSNIDLLRRNFENAESKESTSNPFFNSVIDTTDIKSKGHMGQGQVKHCDKYTEQENKNNYRQDDSDIHEDLSRMQSSKTCVRFNMQEEMSPESLTNDEETSEKPRLRYRIISSKNDKGKQIIKDNSSAKYANTCPSKTQNVTVSTSDNPINRLGNKGVSTEKDLTFDRESCISGSPTSQYLVTSRTSIAGTRPPGIERRYTSTEDYQARMETKRKILLAAKNRQAASFDVGMNRKED